ncbi:MAG: hypothetical protein GF365_00865 [Candidatus Buchananbacteria bacterium]|nr:hypothetical protein [Candidatus Buchananbacteria bacterium]
MFTHLQPKQYYIDRYDRLTVDECRFAEKSFDKISDKDLGDKVSKEEKERAKNVIRDVYMYTLKGESYADKETMIQKWMNNDKARDEKIENAKPIKGVSCLICNSPMKVFDKELSISEDNEPVMFWYSCTKCGKRRLFYDNGKEYRPKLTKKEMAEIDLNEKIEEPVDENCEADRERFCLTAEEGQQYLESKRSMQRLHELAEEVKNRSEIQEEKEAKIEKINFPEVKSKLIKVFNKYKLTDIQFSQPEIKDSVSVIFTAVLDNEDSIPKIKKLIINHLTNTNWEMKSLEYKLGIVKGLLEGR